MELLLHFLSFLQWKVFKKSKIAQIYYYDPQSAGIDLQSPQSDSTPWTLTLDTSVFFRFWYCFSIFQIEYWYFSISKAYWTLVLLFSTSQCSNLVNHFGKRTGWSLIFFLSYLNILAQLLILVKSLYVPNPIAPIVPFFLDA